MVKITNQKLLITKRSKEEKTYYTLCISGEDKDKKKIYFNMNLNIKKDLDNKINELFKDKTYIVIDGTIYLCPVKKDDKIYLNAILTEIK